WSALLRSLFAKFRSDPHAIVHWMTGASPKDFATFAPGIVEHALASDPVAVELLRLAGGHVDALAQRLIDFGVDRLSLVGGLAALASWIEPWRAASTRHLLPPPRGAAVPGPRQLPRKAAKSFPRALTARGRPGGAITASTWKRNGKKALTPCGTSQRRSKLRWLSSCVASSASRRTLSLLARAGARPMRRRSASI